MNYLELLTHSYEVERTLDDHPSFSRMAYLGDHIFGFVTYEDEIAAFLSKKAVEVCEAISNRTTFDYIKDPEDRRWFIVMCNMPFFAERIDWGTSIRGAWWDFQIALSSCGLWESDQQILTLEFNLDEWNQFIAAIVEFARTES